jgi:nucleoside-diphosphate-sugar epimerase
MRILLTGGAGFFGSHITDALEKFGHYVSRPGSGAFDLLKYDDAARAVSAAHWDCVIHAAARCGGIGANMAAPADFWSTNLLMGLNILRASAVALIPKLVMIGSTCSYPITPKTIPFVEDEIFDGYPEPTNAPYGIAKRALLAGAWAYRTQHKLNVVTVVPTNLFGPRDHFDREKSHVIPAMILKFHEAKEEGSGVVHLWGTGKPSRDFLYVRDAARAILYVVEEYDQPQPLNLGSGQEVSIAELASVVMRVVGYDGGIEWNPAKPDGQPRRVLDTSRTLREIGWKTATTLEEGIAETYEWYKGRLRGQA